MKQMGANGWSSVRTPASLGLLSILALHPRMSATSTHSSSACLVLTIFFVFLLNLQYPSLVIPLATVTTTTATLADHGNDTHCLRLCMFGCHHPGPAPPSILWCWLCLASAQYDAPFASPRSPRFQVCCTWRPPSSRRYPLPCATRRSLSRLPCHKELCVHVPVASLRVSIACSTSSRRRACCNSMQSGAFHVYGTICALQHVIQGGASDWALHDHCGKRRTNIQATS